MTLSKLWSIPVVALTMMALPVAGHADGPPGLVGKGLTGVGLLQISAVVLHDGSLVGHSNLVGRDCMPGGDCDAVGPVLQAVPPSYPRDFWCITVQRTEAAAVCDLRINWYIRDVGDGRVSFDEYSFKTDLGIDCDLFPDPPQPLSPLLSGDFREVR
jgi:hypothetical protein